MGYRSYVDNALQSNMAKSPDVVSSFLVELSKAVQPKAVEVLVPKGFSSSGFWLDLKIWIRYLNGSIFIELFFN